MWWDRQPGGHGGRAPLSPALEPAEGPWFNFWTPPISASESLRIYTPSFLNTFPSCFPSLQHTSPGYRGKLSLEQLKPSALGIKPTLPPNFPTLSSLPVPRKDLFLGLTRSSPFLGRLAPHLGPSQGSVLWPCVKREPCANYIPRLPLVLLRRCWALGEQGRQKADCTPSRC